LFMSMQAKVPPADCRIYLENQEFMRYRSIR
jgi:hypothetical protein